MGALKKAGNLGCRSLSIEVNQKIARVLREFLSKMVGVIYRQDLNKLRIIRVVTDNNTETKIIKILTRSVIGKYWSKKRNFP